MPAKRNAIAPTGPAAKKAKASTDPVQKSIQVVVKALNDDTVIVPGPESCRDMLVSLAPFALKSPLEERHENQSKVIAILKETFDAEHTKQQAVVDEQQAVVDAASSEKAEKVAIKEEAEAKLKAHKAETALKKQALSKAEEVVDESKEYLKRANQALAKAVKHQADIGEEQTHHSGVVETFKSLKEGVGENAKETKKNIGSIVSVLKELEVEEALIKSLPQALATSQADRGHFDGIALQQVETTFDGHSKHLEDKVADAQSKVDEQEVAKVASEAVVELAAEKQSACEKVIEEADLAQEKLFADLTAARAVVKEHTKVVGQRTNALEQVQLRLKMISDVQSSIESLENRAAPQPEVEPVVVEPVVEAAIEIENAMKVASPARGNAIPAF
eukprot:gnl/MRDRNA2_/MRDRNA2_89699_c0_seq1.p1 gnl/MRDRNA2_/MRDRNA2_89699_c0~~gnl/MRDRNA2_/MRDRNA2_89699_c0_seq1.p1  ORF type:complete len:390 (-),score=138.53 gnl/MRDRNA2_/MRDRNA2_89699_c0_seq1:115-1284(-)